MEKLKNYRSITENMSIEELIAWGIEEFGSEKIALASSFSIEDQVLTYCLQKINKRGRFFTLDTGRLFPETYDVMEYTRSKYGIKYEIGFPENDKISQAVKEKGPNFFRNSIEDRKECCAIRKLEPLRKILKTTDCWITGLRREQSVTRVEIHKIDWDEQWEIYKLNPLVNWDEKEVWEFIVKNEVPFNPLQKRGYKSVGCACCTRAVKQGEDLRDGRWWWENPEHKECGLHWSPYTNIKQP